MTSQFLTPLRYEKIGTRRWRLLEPLKYYSARHRGIFVAPPGFETDLASIPRGLWNILPKEGQWDRPGVIHDAAYAGALLTRDLQRVHLIKPFADELFYEACRAEGVGRVKARLMYWAVSVFGDGAYRSVTHENVS